MIAPYTVRICHIFCAALPRRVIWAALIFLLAALCWGCSGPRKAPPTSARVGSKAGGAAPGKAATINPLAGATGKIRGGEIIVADPTGRRWWRGAADSIEYDYDRQRAVLHDVRCVFIENAKQSLEARAPVVTVNLKERRVLLSKGVTAQAPETRTLLRADRIQWQVKEKELDAWGNVKYVRGDMMIEGDHLRADLALKHARLVGKVQMQAVEPFKSK
jgi:LPS export ABC transporter protein LptC